MTMKELSDGEKKMIADSIAHYLSTNTPYSFEYEEVDDGFVYKLEDETDDFDIHITSEIFNTVHQRSNVFNNKISSTVDSLLTYIISRWKAVLHKDHNKIPHLEAGKLKKLLQTVPDSMPIYYERIHDKYFDEHGWSFKEQHESGLNNTIKVKSPQHGSTTEHVRAFNAHVQGGRLIITAHY